MSTLDAVWSATTADQDGGENVTPPVGLYIIRIAGTRAGVSKAGEGYFAIDLKDDANGHTWLLYKSFTKDGQPHEGRIKSAKITLRQLGLDVASPTQLEQALKSIEARYFSVEVKASDKVNPTTGAFYTNTDIVGPASAPTVPVTQPLVGSQVGAGVLGPVVQAPVGASFPAAVAGTPPTVVAPAAAMQAQVIAAQQLAATQPDTIPFD